MFHGNVVGETAQPRTEDDADAGFEIPDLRRNASGRLLNLF